LLFPWTSPLSKTFALLNGLGLRLPANLTPVEELQLASAWHAAAALVLTCLVAIHLYLRTHGIQGAFSAMGTGEVDVNWARQHHSLWAEREIKRMEDASATDADAARMVPAE
jgi:formate dehydrogenase subunit gamma